MTRTRVDLSRVGGGALISEIVVDIDDDALRAAITAALSAVTESATHDEAPARVVRLRTHKRLARVVDRVEGAFVVVEVRAENAARVPSLVEAIRARDPAGVQLVWDGITPPRRDVERPVFAALEDARATPAGPPVVVAASHDVCFALLTLARDRARAARPRPPR